MELLQDPNLETVRYTSNLFSLLNNLTKYSWDISGWEKLKEFFDNPSNAVFSDLNDLLKDRYEEEHKHNNYKTVIQNLVKKIEKLSAKTQEEEKKDMYKAAYQLVQVVMELKNQSPREKTHKLIEVLTFAGLIIKNPGAIDSLEPILRDIIKNYFSGFSLLGAMGMYGPNKTLSGGKTLIDACENLINAAHMVNVPQMFASPVLSCRDTGSIN
jgi:hypothetical protein